MASGAGVGPPRPVRERHGQNNQQLNNTQAPPKLEFQQAMRDFKNMFPTLDDEIIEAVLRANNGLVDATIDQLLSMGAGNEYETEPIGDNSFTETPDFPSLPSYTQTTTHNEPPPAYTPRAQDRILLDISTPIESSPPAFTSFADVRTTQAYKAWNPPLLGQLPDDFLRLDIRRTSSSRTVSSEASNEQFLEDEKIALYLQNEEFMKELSRNKDFLTSLERDQSIATDRPETEEHHLSASDEHGAIGSLNTPASHDSNEEDFKEKLKHMGKSTRKKFNQLAKVFSRKKRPVITNEGSGISTANLLQDYEDDSDDDDLIRKHEPLEALEESDSEDDERLSPHQTSNSQSVRDNREPLEFFAEDNEFHYKDESNR